MTGARPGRPARRGQGARARAGTAVAVAVLAALATVAAGCGMVGGGGGGYRVTAYFERAVSVFASSDVRVLGLPAGEVEAVVIDGDRVRVELRVDDDVPLPVDVHAALVPQSLIGERYVQLTPAWTEGQPRLQDLDESERVVPVERTIVPIEPDEALGALNDFLRQLDPDNFGRLVDNAADTLEGNGPHLNRALETVTGLVDSFARRDGELAALVDNFDRFTATVVTREAQLGEVLDAFAGTTAVLAAERDSLERLLAGLARVSVDGFDLVAEHSAALRRDVDTLARLGRSLVTNLDAVTALLDSGPLLADGLLDAYNPTLRAMNLRTQFGPVAHVALEPVLQAIFGDHARLPCVPVDTACPSPPDPGAVTGRSAAPPVTTAVAAARTPIDDVLDALAAPGTPPERRPAPSVAARVAGGLSAAGGFLRDAAESLAGVGG